MIDYYKYNKVIKIDRMLQTNLIYSKIVSHNKKNYFYLIY